MAQACASRPIRGDGLFGTEALKRHELKQSTSDRRGETNDELIYAYLPSCLSSCYILESRVLEVVLEHLHNSHPF